MNSSYLKYQFEYYGIRDLRILRRRSYELSSWEIYELSARLQETVLYLADYRQLALLPPDQDCCFWCLYNCPEEEEISGPDGLYVSQAHSFPRILKLLQKIFRDYDKWEFALQYPGDIGPENLLNLSTDILHMPMTIIDNKFQFLAQNTWHTSMIKRSGCEQPAMDSIIWSRKFQECTFRKGVFHFDLDTEQKELLCYNIILSNRFYARFMAGIEEPAWKKIQEHLFERLAKGLEEIFANQKAMVGHLLESREFYEAVEMLLEGKALPNDSALRKNQWFSTNDYQIVVFQFHQHFPMEEGEQYLFRQLSLIFPESCVIKRDRDFICIRNLSIAARQKDDFRVKLPIFLREHVAKAGISNPFPGTRDFSQYLKQSYDALRIGEQAAPHFWYYYFKQYAFEYLLSQCTLSYPPSEVAAPELVRLKQADLENGTDLFQTLGIYLQTGCSATKSAQRLYIHRTSLLKRISKIEDLTGLHLKDPDTQLYLMLSYKLLERA